MRRTIALGAIILVTGGLAPVISGAAQASQPQRADVVLPDAHSVVLRHSRTAEEYRIFVALPPSYGSGEKRYPVLYTLDAHSAFAMITQTYRLLQVDSTTPDLILVGIGYDGTGAARRGRRGKDLTPTRVANDPHSGGSKEFIDFISETLIPFVDATYRTVPQDRGIHGHSIGGLFVLHALFTQPELFRRYIASSPSLWWDDAVLLKQESEFGRRHTRLDKAVFLSVGAREADDMRQHFQPFVDTVRSRQYSGLSLDAVLLPDEDHLSIVIPAFVRGLRAVYR